MSSKKQLDDKHQKILRKLLQLPENKKCFDCTEKGPFYACTTLGTFVCTTCSGIHREFQHHVKSISMASFKPEEVQFLEEMGNGRAREIWLAYWTPDDYPEPESTDRTRVREFMKLKYERKKWLNTGKPGTSRTNGNSARSEKRSKRRDEDTPKVEPIESILGGNIPPISITHNVNLPLPNGSRREEPRVVAQPVKPKQEFLVGWEDPLPAPVAHARSPQLTPQFPGAPTHAPVPAGPGSAQALPHQGSMGGLESVFTQPEPAKAPNSTIWPPPPAGSAGPAPHMGGPGAMPVGGMGAFPPAAVPHFQQVSPQVFQQMTPQQQQQYLVMQQQWIQQQQFMLQQRMAHMTLAGPPPGSGGAGMMMMHTPMGPAAGGPGGHMGAFPGAGAGPMPGMPPGVAMGTNPFLVGGPAPGHATGGGSGGVLAPTPYGSSGRPGGGAPPPSNGKNDTLFADLSPIPPKPAGGSAASVPSAPVSRGPGMGMASSTGHSPFFPAAPTPSSPVLSPGPNPFGPPPGQGNSGIPPTMGGAPAGSSSGGGFNPFGSLI